MCAGKLIADVCEFGDALITKMTSEIYKTKKMEKGIAFPTCISVNETVGHYSPLKSESKSLAAGDSVKIDLGVHLDGHIALVAHTVVLGASAAAPVTGPAADVMTAAYKAAEIALRLIKPGNKNTQVSTLPSTEHTLRHLPRFRNCTQWRPARSVPLRACARPPRCCTTFTHQTVLALCLLSSSSLALALVLALCRLQRRSRRWLQCTA